MSRLVLLLTLLLQLTPQIHWKSEVREAPEGNQIVLTGDLDEGIDHVTGTVTYMPCKGDACYMPVDWDFEVFIDLVSANSDASKPAPEMAEPAGTSGDRSGVAAVPSGNRATLGIVRGGTASRTPRQRATEASGR